MEPWKPGCPVRESAPRSLLSVQPTQPTSSPTTATDPFRNPGDQGSRLIPPGPLRSLEPPRAPSSTPARSSELPGAREFREFLESNTPTLNSYTHTFTHSHMVGMHRVNNNVCCCPMDVVSGLKSPSTTLVLDLPAPSQPHTTLSLYHSCNS